MALGFVYNVFHLREMFRKRRLRLEFLDWEKKGKPVPPPNVVKQRVLREYSKNYGLKLLVETGTFLGDMVDAMRNDFDRIYSIELSKDLHERAVKRFQGIHTIELIHGDSGSELEKLINKIHQPALFWLDSHYSAGETAKGAKDTPIIEELQHIFNAADLGHVIIIDDARSFGTDPAYPTIEEVSKFVVSKRSNVVVVVKDDSIRIVPKK
jgi:hypothetical protein